MNRRPDQRNRSLIRTLAPPASALLILSLQACSTPESSTALAPPERALEEAFAINPEEGLIALRELAQRERTEPRFLDASDPVWALLGVEAPGDRAPPDKQDGAPLAQAIKTLASDVRLPTPAETSVSAEDREGGAFLLASAVAQLDAGEAAMALDALDRASSLDPSSSPVQSARVRALLALNRRAESLDAALTAIELGGADPLSLVVSALGARDEGDHQSTAAFLALAIESGLDGLGPSVRPVALGALGESMLELGWTRAGAEALTLALTQAPDPTSTDLLRSDLVRLLGRRDALWTSVGDALREHDPDGALAAYARANTLGPTEPGFQDKRLGVLLRSGRPSEGAVLTIEEIQRSGRPPNNAETALIRAVGSAPEAAPALAGALLGASAALDPPIPTTRAALLIEAARLSPVDRAAQILRAELFSRPYNDRIARELLASTERELPERVRIAAELIAQRPALYRRLSAALLSAQTTPAEIRRAAQSLPGAWPEMLLRAGLDLQLRRPRDAFDELATITDAPPGAIELAHIEAGSAIGRWDVVEAALSAISKHDPEPSAVRVRALRGAHRFEEASRIAEQLPTAEQLDVALLLELAELSVQLQRPRDAELYLEMGSEVDPYDERILGARLTLYGPNGLLADTAQHTRALRALRERAPEGMYAALLGAQELAASGILDEAQRRLRTIAQGSPDERGAFELLHQIWTRQDDPESTKIAIAWLESLVLDRPGSPAPSGALARLLAREDRLDEALRVIDTCEANAAAPVLARLREQLLRANAQGDEADALARARLEHPTLSIDEALELGELQVRASELDSAHTTLERAMPAGLALTPAQRARLTRLASDAVGAFGASVVSEDLLAKSGRPVLTIIELTYERVPNLPWALHNARIALSALAPESVPAEIQRVIEQAIESAPERAIDAYRVGVRTLLSGDRVSEAVELSTLGAVREGYLDEELFTDAISVAAQMGEIGDARALIERLDEHGLVEPAARMLRPEPDTPIDSPESQRAELAYQVASIAAFLGRDGLSEDAYRLALEHDPTHAWANNDLGYLLVDQGSDVRGGEALIARAYERLPDSPNVTDSLAWARYKLGQLRDMPGGEAGAITLLRRAIALQVEGDRGNATLHDHLGDALWRDGQSAEASEAWLDAETIALEQSRAMRRNQAGQGSGQGTLERLDSRLRSIRRKLRAVQAGEAPPVAPIVEQNPQGDPDG